MKVLTFALLLLAGCPTRARSAADQDECLAKADAAMQLEVAKRCETEVFADCPEHDAIVSTWEIEARKCR